MYCQGGWWQLHLHAADGGEPLEEELYTEDNVLVCSRGPGAHRVFTLDAPVSNALRWGPRRRGVGPMGVHWLNHAVELMLSKIGTRVSLLLIILYLSAVLSFI